MSALFQIWNFFLKFGEIRRNFGAAEGAAGGAAEGSVEGSVEGMSTRGRKRPYDDITGGSSDYNPQWLNCGVSQDQSSPDAAMVKQIPIPIPRMRATGDKQLVMEILQVVFKKMTFSVIAGSTVANYMAITTNPGILSSALLRDIASDPRTLVDHVDHISTFSATGVSYMPGTFSIDCTDEAGHGVLVATDNVYFVTDTTLTGATNFTAHCKILYRWKEVGLGEYIGIVQSQQ